MKILNDYIPGLYKDENGGDLMAVLTTGAVGAASGRFEDLAVYIGIVKLPACDDSSYYEKRSAAAERVAACGSKVGLSQAKIYFPEITESNYRA